MSAPKLSLEGEICEVADMANLTARYVGDTIDSLLKHRAEGQLAMLGPAEADLIKFCVYHLNLMATQMKERFLRERGSVVTLLRAVAMRVAVWRIRRKLKRLSR